MKDRNVMIDDVTESNFHFSAISVDKLSATEYTLATIVMDQSGSTSEFQKEQIAALESIIDACRKSPRAENLMIRFVTFNDQTFEEHGFRPLSTIQSADYRSISAPTGMTALNDGVINAIEATKAYGKKLMEDDFGVNAIVFITTDGDDNKSKNPASKVKQAIKDLLREEAVESIRTVLIGINTSYGNLAVKLEKFKDEAGIDQYEKIENATASGLAKMADFVSKSISAQQQSLGTGGPSKALTF
jgi:von Willebrand factor type A domain.